MSDLRALGWIDISRKAVPMRDAARAGYLFPNGKVLVGCNAIMHSIRQLVSWNAKSRTFDLLPMDYRDSTMPLVFLQEHPIAWKLP